MNPVGGRSLHSLGWTASWLGIVCRMRNCGIDRAINYRAAPIVIELNFNHSFLCRCGGRSCTTKKDNLSIFFLFQAVAAASSKRAVSAVFFFVDFFFSLTIGP